MKLLSRLGFSTLSFLFLLASQARADPPVSIPEREKSAAAEIQNVDFTKGSAVVFWCSWCAVTFKKTAEIADLLQSLQENGMQIRGISFDLSKENLDAAVERMGDRMAGWQQTLNSEAPGEDSAKTFNVEGLPAVVFLDSEGEMLAIYRSPEHLPAALRKNQTTEN